MYKLKYLKYKKKYLNLKNNLKGGGNNLQQNNIFMAVQNNDMDQVQTLINNNPGVVNEINDNGKTPLFIAVETANIPMINLLIDRGANINLGNSIGKTVIHFFLEVFFTQNIDNAVTVLKTLIEKGADVNIRDNLNVTSLMYFTLFLNSDGAFSANLDKNQIDSDPNLSKRFTIYNNILNILINNIQNLRETILNTDLQGRTLFSYLENGGFLDTYYINFFNDQISKSL